MHSRPFGFTPSWKGGTVGVDEVFGATVTADGSVILIGTTDGMHSL